MQVVVEFSILTQLIQDGNFRVGELFKVEQPNWYCILMLPYFELDGLSELRLGGVTLGGTNAVIKEFSYRHNIYCEQ